MGNPSASRASYKDTPYFNKPLLQYGTVILKEWMCFDHTGLFKIICSSMPGHIRCVFYALQTVRCFTYDVSKTIILKSFNS